VSGPFALDRSRRRGDEDGIDHRNEHVDGNSFGPDGQTVEHQIFGERLVAFDREIIANAPAVLDYVDYSDLAEGLSIGLTPDGEPRNRRLFTYVTPGAGNDAELPQPVLDCYVSEEREFVVTWETVPGLVYRLDTRNSFGGDIWTKVTEGVADSTQGSFSKSLGSEPSFYRIVVKPQAP